MVGVKIPRDFQIQTDKIGLGKQPDNMVAYKHEKKALVLDFASPSDSNVRIKQHKKPEKYWGMEEEVEMMWPPNW